MFSLDVPQAVNNLLQAAVVASRTDRNKAERLFSEALSLDSTCLQTYFALYKFYFYQARLQEAEKFVVEALQEASRQGGFPADYRILHHDRQWDLYASEAALFYLYSLKALAFIKLRQEAMEQACSILEILKVLDPEDRSGASVIMQLAVALTEDS